MALSGEAAVASARRIFYTLLIIYGIACAALYVEQTRFIFFPEREITATPSDFGCTASDVSVPEGAHQLSGWWLPGTNGKTVIYFHGNGGNIGENAEHACRFQKMGFSTLLFDYRGYGNSDGGFPNERKVYADADSAWSYLIEKHIAPADIVIYGHSLGGAVAIEIAKRHPDARGLIVESTFTSLTDMSERDRLSRVFPLKLLMTEHMDSLGKISSVKMPILFIHGTADSLVPAQMTERLFDRATGSKSLFLVSGAGHENCAATAGKQYSAMVLQFLHINPQQQSAKIAAVH